uniref:hypothetical protein n=1 Tax=Nocardioides dongxiaopingii TaxID=2576036 RepID=UPI001BB0AD2D
MTAAAGAAALAAGLAVLLLLPARPRVPRPPSATVDRRAVPLLAAVPLGLVVAGATPTQVALTAIVAAAGVAAHRLLQARRTRLEVARTGVLVLGACETLAAEL